LIFFWLETVELAKERVKIRVSEGRHNIPEEVIERRYKSGLKNFFLIYKDQVDEWMFVDNSYGNFDLVSKGNKFKPETLIQEANWMNLKKNYHGE
jgi:predicted ABC-type ATPase